jgi:hypothetical protein
MYVVANATPVQRVDACVQVCNDADYNVGLELFRLLFKRSEQIQRIFMVNVADFDNLAMNGRILSHAAVVKVWSACWMHTRCKQGALTSVLALFTARLQQPPKSVASSTADTGNDRLLLYVRSLGARHAFFRARGFTPELWFPFADGLAALVATWPLPIYHRRAIKAMSTAVFRHTIIGHLQKIWTKLVCFLVVNMRYGYNHAVLERNLCMVDSNPMMASARDGHKSDWAMHEKQEADLPQQSFAYRTRSTSDP